MAGAISIAPAIGVTLLELRTDGASIHPRGDPVIEQIRADRYTFPELDQVILLVTPRTDVRLDSAEGLRFIKSLDAALKAMPEVEAIRLRSAASFLEPIPGEHLFLAKPILSEIPDDPAAVAGLVRRLRSSAISRGLLLDPDGKAAALYVPLAGQIDRERFIRSLSSWANDRGNPLFEVHMAGPAVVEAALGDAIVSELKRLVPIMAAIIVVLLAICLRSAGGVLVIMTKAGLLLLWTFGAMGLSGVPVTLVTTIMPVLLMPMCLTDEVHLLARFQHLALTPGGLGAQSVIERSLRELARPIVLTSLTTAAGFLSFFSVSTAPLRDFGLFMALGILLALLMTFTLVPAMVVAMPGSWMMRRRPRAAPLAPTAWHGGRLTALLLGPGLAAGCILVTLFVPGAARLRVQDSWVENLDPGSPVVAADRLVNQRLWGTYRLDLVLSGGRRLFFVQPEGIVLLEKVTAMAERAPHVGGTLSALPLFEMAAEAERASGPISALPAEVLLNDAFLLHTAARQTDFDQVMSGDDSSTQVRLFVKDADYQRTAELEDHLARTMPPLLAAHPGLRWHLGGDLAAAQSTVRAIVGNMLRSAAWTIAGVGLLLVVGFRSISLAARAIIPIIAGIVVVLGIIGYAGLPLGIATSMFVALAAGVGVDFAIHFCHAWRTHSPLAPDRRSALAGVLDSTGRSLRWNTIVLSVGLLSLLLSRLAPNRNLGLLLSASLVACYAATLMFLPSLMRFEKSAPARDQAAGLMTRRDHPARRPS